MTDPKRADERFRVECHARVRYAGWPEVRAAALNASRGGLFVTHPQPAPVGTRIEVTLELPDGGELDVHGQVAHVIGPERARAERLEAGMGVRLDAGDHLEVKVLEELSAQELDES